MKITMLRNPGTELLKKLNVDEVVAATLVEGATVDVKTEVGNLLIEERIAELHNLKTVAGERPIHAVPAGETSPVSAENAAEAIEEISRMRSREKLQHIIDNDQRVTVTEAAKKRIGEL